MANKKMVYKVVIDEPSCCSECPFCYNGESAYICTLEEDYYLDFKSMNEERPSWCPLEEEGGENG